MKNLRFAVLAALSLAGCGSGMVASDSDVDGDTSALSTVTAGFVTVKTDTRRCAAPYCGGYFLSQPSHSTAAIYVAGFDFTQAGLSDADVSKVTSAPVAELVLRGKLSKKDKTTGTQSFIVLDAYRGMPGVTAGASDKFFSVASNGRECVAAPCDNLTATQLNSTAKPKDFSNLSVASAAANFVDQDWLSHRVSEGGALVAASLTAGAKLAGGTEEVLDATQVFLHLPEGVGPCPEHVIACSGSKIQVFERDDNRCVISTGCVTAGACPMYMPACPADYTLSSWHGGTSGCPTYACDPSWILQ